MVKYISGFLDKNGVLYPCNSYGHISKAEELVEKFNITKGKPYELCEDTLLKNGWICIRVRDVYKSVYDYNCNVLFITDKQQEFFEKHKSDFNEHQLADIERLIRDFGVLYKYHNGKDKNVTTNLEN